MLVSYYMYGRIRELSDASRQVSTKTFAIKHLPVL